MYRSAKTFEDLIVWQKAHSLVLHVYELTQSLPDREQYGLTSQIRRASVSVPANIAEGFSRKTNADKLKFLNIAQSSLEEARYYLILIKDLGYTDVSEIQPKLEEVSKILTSYRKALNRK